MSSDDAVYRRSVRNMSMVLAGIVITVFAALFIPPLVSPLHDNFQRAVSQDSSFGFTLHLALNTTAPAASGHVMIRAWLNNTSSSLSNITASKNWPPGLRGLWGRICTTGWPIGIGVMKGHYDQVNYTLGNLLPLPQPLAYCPVQASAPSSFVLEPHSSKALLDINGSPQYWTLDTSYTFGYLLSEGLPPGSLTGQLPRGVYTVVLADEWGDVITTNFRVS